MADDIARAVLAHEEVARYLRGEEGRADARARVYAYLDELRTRQRTPIYRALKHPLYPIYRKIDLRVERVDIPQRATAAGRVVYVSNHKSHLDYLVEPLAIDIHAIRQPVIAAGINLFGGPLGLLHRHVTGAIPIRRNSRDPAYLATLKAYVAELLERHDLLFYIEGGRSYSGELKPPKTGLVHAALQAQSANRAIVPTAVAYDLVLEDRMLARQASRRQKTPFARELTEMVRRGVGYRSRSFITFGDPIPLDGWDPASRRDVVALAHQTHEAIGRLYKVLPTALVATAVGPSLTARQLEARVAPLVDTLAARGANLAVTSARQAVEEGTAAFLRRRILVIEHGRYRVRERTVLRYYARTIQHLLPSRPGPLSGGAGPAGTERRH